MAVIIDGTSGINTPGVVNTAAETIATTLAVTGVTTFAAGAVGTPSITTTGDTNTGIFFPAADTVAASTAGTERMRIDSAGRVTMPYQPAFNVTSTVSMAFQNVWTYNTTHVNIGGHMNISNGRFTAPIAGTYVFFFGTIGQTTHSDSDIFLQKNGTNTLEGVARPDDSGAWASMGAGTGIMTLGTNDFVSVYSSPGNSYSDSNQWLHFRGYLLG